jgi:hypothetical protein
LKNLERTLEKLSWAEKAADDRTWGPEKIVRNTQRNANEKSDDQRVQTITAENKRWAANRKERKVVIGSTVETVIFPENRIERAANQILTLNGSLELS